MSTDGGVSLTMEEISETEVSPWNGRLPVAIYADGRAWRMPSKDLDRFYAMATARLLVEAHQLTGDESLLAAARRGVLLSCLARP